jgi:NAD(P)-dependent dehydrogenase (short-subunit alcohol dehydrogenase family)
MPRRSYSSLEGLVIVITGGARGIGLATARACHAQGARVAIGDLDAATLTDAAAGLPGSMHGVLDVTDEASYRSFLQRVERELGPVDVLVSNAGIMPLSPFTDESVEVARRQLDVNVLGPILGAKLVLPAMLERGRGHIVSIASVAGRTPCPGAVTYAATKAAVLGFTDSLRVELADTPITTTAILPSVTATELTTGMRPTPFVPTARPEMIADAIVASVLDPRPEIVVPRTVGVILRAQAILGRRVRDAFNHALGADRLLLDVDTTARDAYELRARTAQTAELRATTSPQLPASAEQADQPARIARG